MNVNLFAPSSPSHARLLSSKVLGGRHLFGTNLLYDINVRLPSEVQPQRDVNPITKYASDPGLVLGRHDAVNRNYICYGLRLGNIRIPNINTALRTLLRGYTQDVHLLASASVDGRVFVGKINEALMTKISREILAKLLLRFRLWGKKNWIIHESVGILTSKRS